VKVGIAIPTYNEAANIGLLVDKIYRKLSTLESLQTTILIIDDSSPDGTADVVKRLAKKYNSKNFKIDLLSRKIKNGLGRAYIEGFNKLLKSGVDFVIQMDADLSHDPNYLPVFIQSSKENDVTIGSRYILGGRTPDWSLTRKILSRGGNTYARLLLGNSLHDYTGGYNMFSANILNKINPSTIKSSGYGFIIELKYMAIQHATTIKEIPIIFRDRTQGESKLPKSTIIKSFVIVPRIRINKLTRKLNL
jgi:dolichol-phosphate mannosyltransferase